MADGTKTAGDKWISGATSNAHGQFKAKAKANGETTKEYASKVNSGKVKASPVTQRQASLAATLMGFNHKGEK